jgi:hypothetical protein
MIPRLRNNVYFINRPADPTLNLPSLSLQFNVLAATLSISRKRQNTFDVKFIVGTFVGSIPIAQI